MQGLGELWKVIVAKGSVEEKRLANRIKPLPASTKAHGRKETVLVLIFYTTPTTRKISLTLPDPRQTAAQGKFCTDSGEAEIPGSLGH